MLFTRNHRLGRVSKIPNSAACVCGVLDYWCRHRQPGGRGRLAALQPTPALQYSYCLAALQCSLQCRGHLRTCRWPNDSAKCESEPCRFFTSKQTRVQVSDRKMLRLQQPKCILKIFVNSEPGKGEMHGDDRLASAH